MLYKMRNQGLVGMVQDWICAVQGLISGNQEPVSTNRALNESCRYV